MKESAVIVFSVAGAPVALNTQFIAAVDCIDTRLASRTNQRTSSAPANTLKKGLGIAKGNPLGERPR
jgi:hypothetical protein